MEDERKKLNRGGRELYIHFEAMKDYMNFREREEENDSNISK